MIVCSVSMSPGLLSLWSVLLVSLTPLSPSSSAPSSRTICGLPGLYSRASAGLILSKWKNLIARPFPGSRINENFYLLCLLFDFIYLFLFLFETKSCSRAQIGLLLMSLWPPHLDCGLQACATVSHSLSFSCRIV